MCAKPAFLRLARAVLVEIVEPSLTKRHHLRMVGQLHQFVGGYPVLLVSMVRMRADGTINVRESAGDLQQRTEPPDARRNGHNASNAGGCRARYNGVEVTREVREIEVAVAVDQHCRQRERPSRNRGKRYETVAD